MRKKFEIKMANINLLDILLGCIRFDFSEKIFALNLVFCGGLIINVSYAATNFKLQEIFVKFI